MSKKVYDLTNKKFGRLTVLYRVEDRISPTNGRKHAMWHCKCECGNEIDALGWQLTGGSKYKCGTNCGFGVYKKDEKGNMKMATGGYLKGGLVDHEINKLWNTNLSDSNAMIKVKAKCELLVDLEIISRDQADNILNTLSAKEETFLWRNRDTYC